MRTLIIITLVVTLTGCDSRSKRDVERASAASVPTSLPLTPGFNDYVRRAILSDGIEVGVITCRDGSSAHFWFSSHHRTRDDGCTLFRFSDGLRVFMTGYFCCEVQLPEKQFASLAELRGFIREHDGVSP